MRIDGLPLVTALEFAVSGGEILCVMGCNGAGKTTLLHTLAGLRDARDSIFLEGRPLASLRRREIARRLALLLQHHDDAFPATVAETVRAARHPHRPLLGGDDAEDEAAAVESLARLGLADFAARDLTTLSGGERQRVAIAAVLAQRTAVLLLDEPLNNLDPRHRLGVMQALREERARGAAVVAVMHDVNLVERFADRVLLLYGPVAGGQWLCAAREQALSADNLSRLYQTPIVAAEIDGRRVFLTA